MVLQEPGSRNVGLQSEESYLQELSKKKINKKGNKENKKYNYIYTKVPYKYHTIKVDIQVKTE